MKELNKDDDSFDSFQIDNSASIIDALKKMDHVGSKLLIVMQKRKFSGLLSVGDVQRAILANIDLLNPISEILRDSISVGYVHDDPIAIKETMIRHRVEFMPIIDSEKHIVDIIFWKQLFDQELETKKQLNLPVVIMAGGKGTRLKPLTNIIPKPLIPIGEKSMIEEIMDKFVNVGCHDFHISINYKSNIIRNYFDDLANLDYNLCFFEEDKPLGTAGSLFLLKNRINRTFFVTNCDIIIDEDYEKIYNFHKENNHQLTIVSAIKQYSIPYGTVQTGLNGQLVSLEEKPDLTFQINTGFYVLEPQLLDLIPENEFYHITSLIEELIEQKQKVGVFPVSEGSWKDIGEFDKYLGMIL